MFEGLNTISEEEISSNEELTAGVGNLAVDAQKRNKATNTEGILIDLHAVSSIYMYTMYQ